MLYRSEANSFLVCGLVTTARFKLTNEVVCQVMSSAQHIDELLSFFGRKSNRKYHSWPPTLKLV